jgi:hypothetical protein
MIAYRCAHCGEHLAEGATCPNHPDGIVEAYDDGNPQPE